MTATDPFLEATPVVDWSHPAVAARAAALRGEETDPSIIAKRCFEWVRDVIRHSQDCGATAVTCSASQVLVEGSGFCYAKSHLLAALLRANGVPAGFCYQRLALDDSGTAHCLHGLNAVLLPAFGWYRLDARGNRPGIDARFQPPTERLAFSVGASGELDLPGVWAAPLPIVVEALQRYSDAATLAANLPDLPAAAAPRLSV